MRMTPEWRLLCVLWIMSSAGVAGITLAMTHKPQTTTIQKTEPAYKVNRLLKTDKGVKLPAINPHGGGFSLTPSPAPAPKPTPFIQGRKFWYA